MSDDEYKRIFSKKLKYYMDLTGKQQIDLMNDLKLGSSTISSWCTGTKLPRMNKIQMLADYFGITKSDLLEENPQLTKKDERDIKKKLDQTLKDLESSDGLMFDGEALDDETKDLLHMAIESALITAKVKAKEKFTPKKYKKED